MIWEREETIYNTKLDMFFKNGGQMCFSAGFKDNSIYNTLF